MMDMREHDRIRTEIAKRMPEGYELVEWRAEDDVVTVTIERIQKQTFTFSMQEDL